MKKFVLLETDERWNKDFVLAAKEAAAGIVFLYDGKKIDLERYLAELAIIDFGIQNPHIYNI